MAKFSNVQQQTYHNLIQSEVLLDHLVRLVGRDPAPRK
jgi:hypothetical protein